MKFSDNPKIDRKILNTKVKFNFVFYSKENTHSKLVILVASGCVMKNITQTSLQKHLSVGVLVKRRAENMLQIYWRIPTSKSDFNKVALQLY